MIYWPNTNTNGKKTKQKPNPTSKNSLKINQFYSRPYGLLCVCITFPWVNIIIQIAFVMRSHTAACSSRHLYVDLNYIEPIIIITTWISFGFFQARYFAHYHFHLMLGHISFENSEKSLSFRHGPKVQFLRFSFCFKSNGIVLVYLCLQCWHRAANRKIFRANLTQIHHERMFCVMQCN